MIALVTPWFGEHLKGGAEQLAWQVAQRLAGRGHPVEVLTTCSRSFLDGWENRMPPGTRTEGSVPVRRFSVDPRDARGFDRVNARLLAMPATSLVPGVPPLAESDEEVFWRGNLNSSRLVEHLEGARDAYDAFLFIPYLYGPIVRGLPRVRARAYLQPCLHDEPYAYLRATTAALYAAKTLLLNSEGELHTLRRIHGAPVTDRAVIVGSGIEPVPARGAAGSGRPRPRGPYVLCLGRRDEGKGVSFLVRCFARLRAEQPGTPLALVLAGPGEGRWDAGVPGVQDLGLVSDVEKAELLEGCLALAQPSLKESYSRVLLEAWRYRKPVLVQRTCAATAGAVAASGGGWSLDGEDEWVDALSRLPGAPAAELADLGARGDDYSRQHGDWDLVLDRYEEVLGLRPPRPPRAPRAEAPRAEAPRGGPARIDQVLPNLAVGDAISNYARALRDRLRARGRASDIYVRHVDPRLKDEAIPVAQRTPPAGAALLYHHSIGTDVTGLVLAHAGPRALIYHNITPGEFFRPYDPALADLLDAGRAQLPSLADRFPVSAGDSPYNTAELEAAGFTDPVVLPIPVDGAAFAAPSDPAVAADLSGAGTNLLFVGRISPQKRQDDLLAAFAEYVRLDPSARLHLVGSCAPQDGYARHLRSLVWKFGLTGRVSMPGSVDEAALRAYFRGADLFWSMSEHEGFCVPLIEAMWFEVPVVAYRSSAIPWTLGDAGILFTSKDDLSRCAALAHVVAGDAAVRDALVAAGRDNRARFGAAAHEAALDTVLARLVGAAAPHA